VSNQDEDLKMKECPQSLLLLPQFLLPKAKKEVETKNLVVAQQAPTIVASHYRKPKVEVEELM